MDLSELLITCFIVFGGVIGYIFQYKDILRTQDASGFSPWVCFILLVSNILRVVFWYGKRFETALLLQSVVMIIFQLVLLELCVRVKRKNEDPRNPRKKFVEHFWNWSYFSQYYNFLSTLFVGVASLSIAFDSPFLWEIVGSAALSIEALLAVPQFIANYKRKSTEGCSKELIASWVIGDVGKLVMFLMRNSPTQFIMCGAFQLFMDFVVLGQMNIYKKKVL
eukprot:GDKJ01048731.1.p1 GENE.GDKJ01048731.1~~GDKJ01048731.1.p1  ORF type:complete len:231 (-),score=40.08 GDKJ01048731.1:63-728(-)